MAELFSNTGNSIAIAIAILGEKVVKRERYPLYVNAPLVQTLSALMAHNAFQN